MAALKQRAMQASVAVGIIGPICLAASQMWIAHEETARARIESERAEQCEGDYRDAMADLERKIESLRRGG